MRLFALALLLELLIVPGCTSAQEPQVFFGNLHSHTSFSDGSATPEVAYTHARDVAGLDFLAITEHNHRRAGRIAGRRSLAGCQCPSTQVRPAQR